MKYELNAKPLQSDQTNGLAADAIFPAIRSALPSAIVSHLDLEILACSFYHDLQAPLRAVDGFLRMLEDETRSALSPSSSRLFQQCRVAISHAQGLAHRFMDFTRLGNLQITKSYLDVSGLAQVIVDCLRASEPQRKVDVVIRSNLVAYGDPLLVQQLLQNLIGNAWKFSAKTAHAHISVDVTAEGVFEVSDNGCGFSVESAAKLFLPFQRLHCSKEYAGHGIGLAIVNRIVELHCGRIWAISSPGQGARFCFTLAAEER